MPVSHTALGAALTVRLKTAAEQGFHVQEIQVEALTCDFMAGPLGRYVLVQNVYIQYIP